MLAVVGVTAIETKLAADTVRLVEAVCAACVPVMLVVPVPALVANP